MNRDLEDELGANPEFRAIVGRLRGGREIDLRRESRVSRGVVHVFTRTSLWLAASLLAVVSLSAWLCLVSRSSTCGLAASPAYGAREYRLSVEEMVATQNPDGSWQNDFLTRRNAKVLQAVESPAARIAHKKALRYLRMKGLTPPSQT